MLLQLSESELMALRSMALDYFLKPDHIEEFHDIVGKTTVTATDLLNILGDDTRRHSGVTEIQADLRGPLMDVDRRAKEIEDGKASGG